MWLKPTSHNDLTLMQFKFTLVEKEFMFDNRLGTQNFSTFFFCKNINMGT